MSLRTSLRGPAQSMGQDKRRVSFNPNITKVTLQNTSDDLSEFDSELAVPSLGNDTQDHSADLLDGLLEESVHAADDMEMTETTGKVLQEGDSDMELTDAVGGPLPDDSVRHDSASISFTGATGGVLEQSMEMTEPLGNIIAEEDPTLKLLRLQELRQKLLERKQALEAAAVAEQGLQERLDRLNRECHRKHHLLQIAQHVIPLAIREFTPTHLTIAFQCLESSITFHFGEASVMSQPLPITSVKWDHRNSEHQRFLEAAGVIKLLSRPKHSKQLRQYLQEAMRLTYSSGHRLPP